MTDGRHDPLLEWQQNAAEALERSQRSRDTTAAWRLNNVATVRPVTPESQVSPTALPASDDDLRTLSSIQISPGP